MTRRSESTWSRGGGGGGGGLDKKEDEDEERKEKKRRSDKKHEKNGSHVFKKSQTMRFRISSECAGTENEKDTHKIYHECEGKRMRNQLWKQEIGIGKDQLYFAIRCK